MSEFSNHENTDGSRPPVEGIPVVPASEARVEPCPLCEAGPGERCAQGCRAQYRQEAGETHNDGADYLRRFWAEAGAPTVVAAVAAAEGHPITPAAPPLGLPPSFRPARSSLAPDPVVVESRPCVAAAMAAWPGSQRCPDRWPGLESQWCAACRPRGS